MKFFVKRKHILFFVAVILSISCIKSCINIQSSKIFKQRVTFSSVAHFVHAYQTNADFALNFEHVLDELNLFVATQAQRMKQDGLWLGQVMPPKSWFHVDSFALCDNYKKSNQFFPYVQKLMLSDDASIAVWGDLHGSVSTVVESLLALQGDGYLDAQFNIVKKDLHLIFLGDFVDKESHGIELLYLVMKLHNQNPGRVFMLRGNHEDAAVNKLFRRELAKKYSDIDQEVLEKIFCLYDHLPVALFAGISGDDGLIHGVQFCHAGFELGYNAQKFLDSDAQFELITKLDRSSVLEQLPDGQPKEQLVQLKRLVELACRHEDDALEQKLIQEAKMEQRLINGHHWLFVELLTWLHKQEIVNALPTLFQDITITPQTNLGDIRLGFSWNSFTDQENNKRLGNRDDLHVLWSYAHFNFGPEATDYFLKLNSGDRWNLEMVVRGHQHQGKMLEDLKTGKGCAVWFDGKLITMVASPMLTGYSSFVVLHCTPSKQNWYIERYAAQLGKSFEKVDIKFE